MRWPACVLLFICAICDANDDLGAYTACRYSYDSTGNRTEKDCDGPKTTYRWDGRGNLLETSTSAQTIRYEWSSDNRQNGGAWQETRYTHTPDGVGQLISEQRQGQTLHVYEDGQGSARLITDEGGQIIETLDFDAFGNEEAGNPQESRHRYTGESYDSATGLYHLRARDYDPKTGRFISMDEHPGSQSIPLTLNKYLYGNADPVNHVDPSGNMSLGDIGAGLNIQGILNTAGLASRALNVCMRVSSVVDLVVGIVQLMQMDPSSVLEGIAPQVFPPKRNFADIAEQFMIGSRRAISMGLPDWSAKYAMEYSRGKRIKSYILYLPVLSPAAPRLIDTRRKIFKTPVKIGIGAVGKNRGSLAGVGLEMGHERMLYRMDINLTLKGHITGRGYELTTFDLPPDYSFHVYRFNGGPR